MPQQQAPPKQGTKQPTLAGGNETSVGAAKRMASGNETSVGSAKKASTSEHGGGSSGIVKTGSADPADTVEHEMS